jgi:hypothetical protein
VNSKADPLDRKAHKIFRSKQDGKNSHDKNIDKMIGCLSRQSNLIFAISNFFYG